jgi:hypothetical protein
VDPGPEDQAGREEPLATAAALAGLGRRPAALAAWLAEIAEELAALDPGQPAALRERVRAGPGGEAEAAE